MRKFVTVLSLLIIIAVVAGCGGDSSTGDNSTVYDTPLSLAPANSHMGGSVQGAALTLSRTVSTFAGTAASLGFIDNTGSAARFYNPNGITTDGTNFYVADYSNNAIRKIDSTGTVTTLQCTDFDTGAAVFFSGPTDITTDGTNLYVVDSGHNSIRIIDAANKVITIGSTASYAGSVDSEIKTNVRFNQPIGITTDGENLYVTDTGNHTIRRIVISSKAVTTMAGSPGNPGPTDGIKAVARFNQPARITTDGKYLYATDFLNRTIRKIDILTGAVSTIAGKAGTTPGTDDADAVVGTDARFNQPNGITTDGTNLYVTDSYNNTIRRISLASPYSVEKISGITYFSDQLQSTGHVDSAEGTPSFWTPIGITTDGTSLFVVDRGNHTIRKIQ